MRLLLTLLCFFVISASAAEAPRAYPPSIKVPTVPDSRMQVPVDPKRALGNSAARVAVVEFADYRCTSCRAFHVRVLPQLQEKYIDTGKIRFFYKDFPVIDANVSVGASRAAYCAGTQGKYWEMQELLFTEQARLGGELYGELADELRLDRKRFDTCLKSPSARRRVESDLADGRKLELRGTPSFAFGRLEKDQVVIERIVTGLPALEVFEREIEALAR